MNFIKKTSRKKIILLLVLSLFLILPNIVKAGDTTSYKLRKVVIDAGHGGKDPGAIGKKLKEKDITLAIALKVGNYIKKYIKDVEVIYTRSTDKFVELDKRAEIANKKNADLFISIHVNASNKRSISGTSTFVMGLDKAADNLEVAKLENSVIQHEKDYKTKYEDYDPNKPESEISFKLYQNAYLNQSISFAQKIQKQFKDRAGRKDRGVRQAGLVVLWSCSMPGVLVETGFITNSAEEKFLSSDYGQSIVASAIFRAFRDYKNELEKTNYKVPEKTEKQNTNTTQKEENIKKTDVIFKVQIASSIKKIATVPSNFKGIQNIKREKSGKKYLYTVGETSSFNEIIELQTKIRKKIPDAFVIAFRNGEKIKISDALK